MKAHTSCRIDQPHTQNNHNALCVCHFQYLNISIHSPPEDEAFYHGHCGAPLRPKYELSIDILSRNYLNTFMLPKEGILFILKHYQAEDLEIAQLLLCFVPSCTFALRGVTNVAASEDALKSGWKKRYSFMFGCANPH